MIRLSASSVTAKIAWRFRSLILSRPNSAVAFDPAQAVVVAGLFRTASGIGQSARACADALERSGITVIRVDLSQAFNQIDLPEDPRYLSRAGDCRTLIVHLNAPEFERASFLLNNWRGTGRRIIGYWAWELPGPPFDWAPATRWLSEIWVPSRFTAASLAPLTHKPVRVVHHYISSQMPPASSLSGGGLRCIALGDAKSSFERKNLIGAVKAFRAARLGETAHLTVKTRGLETSPQYKERLVQAMDGDPRIDIVEQSLSHDEVMQMIIDSDVLISLHRSEGFGLAIAEAMFFGKAVVATDWSGSTDFLDDSCGFPVPAELIPVVDTCGVYADRTDTKWADASIPHAAEALTRLAADSQLRQRVGEAARAQIHAFADGHQYLEALTGAGCPQ